MKSPLINLDYQSRTPIYEQIVSSIEKYVALGILREREQIPSIREMAASLGVNTNTVKKDYDILENKKVITTVSTKFSHKFTPLYYHYIINLKKKKILLNLSFNLFHIITIINNHFQNL